MALSSPNELFIYELASIYDGERKKAEILAQATEQITDDQLAAMFRAYLDETRRQTDNLEQCFELLAEPVQEVNCLAVDGVREECRDVMALHPSPLVLSMFLLDAAAKLQHMQIAAYRGLINKALLMGESECALLLQTNLVQDEDTATRLERVNHNLSERTLVEA